jgi:hypothetical protein
MTNTYEDDYSNLSNTAQLRGILQGVLARLARISCVRLVWISDYVLLYVFNPYETFQEEQRMMTLPSSDQVVILLQVRHEPFSFRYYSILG